MFQDAVGQIPFLGRNYRDSKCERINLRAMRRRNQLSPGKVSRNGKKTLLGAPGAGERDTTKKQRIENS